MNQHIVEYLEYYLDPKTPASFAVHLGGAWGVGKTHFLLEYLREHDAHKKDPSFIYISLNGVCSSHDLKRALFNAAFPFLQGREFKVASSIARTALNFVNLQTDVKLSDVADLPAEKLIVIDDLERSTMNPVDVLGELNALVEHDKHKLIILSNEDAIPDKFKERFYQSREKLIGQSFTVLADFDSAFAHFVNHLRTDLGKRFFSKNKIAIAKIYRESQSNNLRTLQRSMEQFERILEVLPDRFRESDSALAALVSFFIALSIEFRTGKVSIENLSKRETGLLLAARRLNSKRDQNSEPDQIDIANSKYTDVDLRSELLSNETLRLILVDGTIPNDNIINELTSSYYFSDQRPEDDWRTVWYGIERSVEEFEIAREKMEERWRTYEFKSPTEIIHVATLRLWLSDLGYGNGSRSELVDETKAYVDTVAGLGAFGGQTPQARTMPSRDAAHGLRFHEVGTPEFDEIIDYLSQSVSKAYEDGKEAWAQELVGLLNTAPERFCAEIAPHHANASRYAYDSVLHLIDVKEFLDAVLKLHPELLRKVFIALEQRYEAAHHRSIGSTETTWIKTVRADLAERAEKSVGITRYLLERIDEWHLSNAVEALDRLN